MAQAMTAAQLGAGEGRAAQTIEAFVGNALDDAKISPLHRRVIALIAAGYFFDVIDFTVFGSLVPIILLSKFATGAEVAAIGSATIFGLFIGTAGQGEFSDRFGRRFIYQFNLLLFGIFTILGALSTSVTLLIVCRFIAGIGLGAEQPLAFAYAGEYSPKRIRGRILAIVHFIGGACVWPIGTALVLLFGGLFNTPEYAWRGVWLLIGIGALIVWVFRFTLPESPRYLATHGKGQQALDVLGRLGIAGPTVPLSTDAASNTKSDPFSVVFSMFPTRVIAGMICFTAFFGVAIGLGAWLPNIMNGKGFTHHQVAPIYPRDELRRAVREPLYDVRARQIRPQDHVGLRVRRRRNHGDGVRQCHDRARADGCRLRHGLLCPGRRQFDADLRVRGVSHQRAGIGFRLGVGRRPPCDCVHHADDLVGAKRLGPHNGVRLPRDPSLDRCRLGDAVGPRGQAKGPR